MTFDFREDLTITIPDISESLDIVEAAAATKSDQSKGLIVEVAAIHAGATANFNYYSAEALEKSLTSWTEPYPKPIIYNHDIYTDAVGRVIGSRMDEDATGSFVRLQVGITDASAMERIRDKRILTGSVGGRAGKAKCSICGVDWVNPPEESRPPCSHRKGKAYDGKIAMLNLEDISFHEYSFVNLPADEGSQILSVGESYSTAECFVIDMNEESIVKVQESGNRNVLASMKKKESLPIYMGLKGSFLTAVALNESEEFTKEFENQELDNTNNTSSGNSEENSMSKNNDDIQTEGESEKTSDILDVLEGLGSDSVEEDSSTEGQDDEGSAEESDEETEASNKDSEAEESDSVEEDETDAEESDNSTQENEEEVTEADEDEEAEADSDEDAEDKADDEEDAEEAQEEASEESTDDSADTDSEESDSETELVDEDTTDEVDEPQEEDTALDERVAVLEDENKRLRTALHRMLAEKVVDTKISVGVNVGERAEAIGEHAKRTASSLADSLRDLAEMEPVAQSQRIPTLDSEVAAIDSGYDNESYDGQSEESEDQVDPENIFVDVLMDRRKM